MSLSYKKPKKDAIPVAKVIDHKGFVPMKKYKIPKAKREVYVNDDYYQRANDDDKVLELENPRESNSTAAVGECFHYLPYIVPGQRQAIFIWGASGSGKSVSARMYIDHVRNLKRPKDKPEVWIFSGNDNHDPAFDGMKNVYFFDLENVGDLMQLSYKEFKDCIVVFDDWESKNETVAILLENLMRQLLEFSRKQNVTIIAITHQAMQGNRTKSIIKECDTFIVYHKNDWNSCFRFMNNYLNMNARDLEQIRRLPGRMLVLRKSHPSVLVSDKLIKIL